MKELISIQAKLEAPKGNYNSFGKYKYRSCEDILQAVKPLLTENNCFITISDEIIEIGGRFYVKATATITNEEGKSFSTTAYAREDDKKTGMDLSQLTGSTSSYARKYALSGLLAIDDEKDSDTMELKEKREVKEEVKWYNAFESQKEQMLEKIEKGKTPQEIIESIEKQGYTVSTPVKIKILALKK